jgi:hypothetical protein
MAFAMNGVARPEGRPGRASDKMPRHAGSSPPIDRILDVGPFVIDSPN